MTSLQTASIDSIRKFAAQMCREYLTGRWKEITAEQLVVKRISGGLSNFLYYVSLPADDWGKETTTSTISSKRDKNECSDIHSEDCNNGNTVDAFPKRLRVHENEPREVLLRIYGQTHGEDALEGMITESVVFALLSERNFGPKLHGIFPGGRIEQYIQARPLKTKELSHHKISMRIAEKMGEIHSLNIPMSKEPIWIWNCMDRWLKSINTILQGADCADSNTLMHIICNFDYAKEIVWLKSVIAQGNYAVMFCHNDLQEGNILFRDTSATNNADYIMENLACSSQTDADGSCSSIATPIPDDCDPDLKIIDFEYCAYNYRGFDIANHFLEWTFDYTNPKFPFFFYIKQQYPTKEQRQKFIHTYLRQISCNVKDYIPTEQEIDSVENEVTLFSMFSHLFWSLWSVVNITSNIEFGYKEYAATRIQEYGRIKQAYIGACNSMQNISR